MAGIRSSDCGQLMSQASSQWGKIVRPGRAGGPVGVDLEGSGWHTYQTRQRDLERDAGWKLGTWRLMHGLGPASASVLPIMYLCATVYALLRGACVTHVIVLRLGFICSIVYYSLLRQRACVESKKGLRAAGSRG